MEEIKLTENISYLPKTWEYKYKDKKVSYDPKFPYLKIINEKIVNELGCSEEELIRANEIVFLLATYFGICVPGILAMEFEQCPTFQNWMTKKLEKIKLVEK